MANHPDSLQLRLQRWAKAYGGEVQAAGTDPLADLVQTIVERMERQGRWKEARVLRVEAFMEGRPETERLQRMRRLGLPMGRSSYYTYLKSAQAIVEWALADLDLAAPAAND